ncbi:MAG: VCBS repeat-containing protein [Planctomycetota bacterium]
MDLDGDGLTDVLSGCYTHRDGSRAVVGEFYLLRGTEQGLAKPERLRGTDGELLVIRPLEEGEDAAFERMCTRPTAVDLDGDGHLDIVSGNETGHFALFRGGPGGFEPENSWLRNAEGERLEVRGHSDPHFADWDADGDLDLLSGSRSGGVSWFPNLGTRNAPRFGDARCLVPTVPKGSSSSDLVLGEDHITGPQIATRVTTADVDEDGKLDLLVGDAVEIIRPAEGLTDDECRRRFAEWNTNHRRIVRSQPEFGGHGRRTAEQEAEMEAFYARRQAHWEKRQAIVDKRSTGYVWLFLRK